MVFLRTLQSDAHRINQSKGFGGPGVSVDRKLMLIVGELAEAQNELRNGHTTSAIYFNDISTADPFKPEGFGIELADALIRILNLMSDEGLDAEELVQMKMNYNATRPFKHGGKEF